jgi:hypothetical protein
MLDALLGRKTKKGKPLAGLPLLVPVKRIDDGVDEEDGSCLPLLNHKHYQK